MRLPITASLLLASFALLAACGDDDDAAPDLGVDAFVMVPAESCVQAGDVGNDIGIGTFCTPRGRECSAFPLAGLCLAAAAPSENQWFCTRLCERDDQCGADARCFGDARGKSCVPSRCLDPVEDGGTALDGGAEVDAGPLDGGGDIDAALDVDGGGDAG
jgi:hypothetical protein